MHLACWHTENMRRKTKRTTLTLMGNPYGFEPYVCMYQLNDERERIKEKGGKNDIRVEVLYNSSRETNRLYTKSKRFQIIFCPLLSSVCENILINRTFLSFNLEINFFLSLLSLLSFYYYYFTSIFV